MDSLCLPLNVEPSNEFQQRKSPEFYKMIETWGKAPVKGRSDVILEQCFKNKYYGLTWVDPDEPHKNKALLTSHPDFVSHEKGDQYK